MADACADAEAAGAPKTHPFPTDDGEEVIIKEP